MNATRLVLPFKGKRTYIQGTELFNAALLLLRKEGEPDRLDFSAHKFIETNQINVVVHRDPQGILPASPSSLRCFIDDVPYSVMYESIEGEGEVARVECNEQLIMGQTAVQGNLAKLLKPSPASMIETLVPMKKRLLQLLFPDLDMQWVFVRAEISGNVSQVETAEVECLTTRESRIYQSLLRVNGKPLGKMFFIGIRK